MPFEIPLIVPRFPGVHEVAEDYAAIMESNRYSNFGGFESEFCQQLAGFAGVGLTAVTVSSATIGLQLALSAMLRHAPKGSRVIVPSFTFAAAPQMIAQLGFRPLFVDIELEGLQPDAEHGASLLASFGSEVAGILFANSFGIGAHNLRAWEELAREAGVPLIIDSAAGFGSRYEDGTPLGGRGQCEVFSFHATKPLAVGEGGAILTKDGDMAALIRRMSNFGLDAAGVPTVAGTNAKLSEFAAAIGLRQLGRLDEIISTRRRVLDLYVAALADIGSFPRAMELSSLAFATVWFPGGLRQEEAIDLLRRAGIEARRYYWPLLHKTSLLGADSSPLPNSERVSQNVISLPCHQGVTARTVRTVAEILLEAST